MTASHLPPARASVLLVALISLPGCGVFGLSREEAEQVKDYQVRAEKYFNDGSRLNDETYYMRALQQLDKALAIDPDNYRSKTRQGWCYLMLGQRRNKKYLRDAEQTFKKVIPLRSDREHDEKTLLGYALTLHRIGHNELSEAMLLEQESRSSEEIANPKARAEEKRGRAKSYLSAAERQLQKMLDLKVRVRTAHKHMMDLKVHQGDIAAALHHGTKLLNENARARAHWEERYRQTQQKGYEDEVRRALDSLTSEELQVRAWMADYYNKLGRYEDALAQVDAVLKINPNLADRYYDRGACLRKLGRKEDAKKAFKKFLGTTNRASKDTKVVDAYEYTYGR